MALITQKGRKRRRLDQHQGSDKQIHNEVNQLYNKAFKFEILNEWQLPDANDCFQNESQIQNEKYFQELKNVKDEMNDIKSNLSDKEINRWHAHTSSTHRGGGIISHFSSGDCQVEIKTQAWFKFHEILRDFPIVPLDLKSLNTVHLCEAPGAFITSLNHFLNSGKDFQGISWHWLATTLNPYYEGNSCMQTIADDRFIKNTMDHWDFGVDNTGNIMHRENVDALTERVNLEMKEVNVVTADGGINCQNDPADQESLIFPLLFCQVFAALKILSPGGCFVIKMFTMYEKNTACLIFLLCSVFQEVHVKKPVTSKAGNSEMYVVCLHYCGQDKWCHLRKLFWEHYGPNVNDSFLFATSCLPSSFLEQLVQCCSFFKGHQLTTIQENLDLFMSQDPKTLHRIQCVRELCTEEFLKYFVDIDRSLWICPEPNKLSGMSRKAMRNRLSGSLEDRVHESQRSWEEYLQKLSSSHTRNCFYSTDPIFRKKVKISAWSTSFSEVKNWKMVIGQPLTCVESSPFCHVDVLEEWRRLCQRSKVLSEEFIDTKFYNSDDALVRQFEKLLKNCNGTESSSSMKSVLKHFSFGDSEDFSFSRIIGGSETGTLLEKECARNLEENAITAKKDVEELEQECRISMSDLCDPEEMKRVCHNDQEVDVTWSNCLDSKLGGRNMENIEMQCKDFAVAGVCAIIKTLKEGGTAFLLFPSLLTRLTVGLVYILVNTFEEVYFYQDVKSLTFQVLVECKKFKGSPSEVTNYLEEVHKMCWELKNDTNRSVLEFIPITALFDFIFDDGITKFNTASLKNHTQAILKAELERLENT